MGTTDGLLWANHIQEILQSQEDFYRNTERVLQDIANIARPPDEEDAANIATKAEMRECMKFIEKVEEDIKCIEKAQEDITNMHKILATNTGKKKENKNRKCCWSHGSCFHAGKQCTARKEGHKEEATFNNKMGGSAKNCT